MQVNLGEFNKSKSENQLPRKNTDSLQTKSDFNKQPQPHTPCQDLTHFGTWVGNPIWVPPKDCSRELAKSMLNRFGPFASKPDCWKTISRLNRSKFTQVRELMLPKSSIRLPQGRLFVTVTEQENFDKIEETVPACVQTRLDEFLAGPAKRRGVKVYYLKPLCIEVGSDLVFTTKPEIDEAIERIQLEVFKEYRRMYPWHLSRKIAVGALETALSIPRSIAKFFIDRKKKEIDAYHAKLEFERRKRAMRALKMRKKFRSDECSFDELIELTQPPSRKDVIDHYVKDNFLSELDKQVFLVASAATLPWFVGLSFAAYQMTMVTLTTTVTVATCDPVFVAQMPGSNGKLLKIGHFDEVDGVMHVEI